MTSEVGGVPWAQGAWEFCVSHQATSRGLQHQAVPLSLRHFYPAFFPGVTTATHFQPPQEIAGIPAPTGVLCQLKAPWRWVAGYKVLCVLWAGTMPITAYSFIMESFLYAPERSADFLQNVWFTGLSH